MSESAVVIITGGAGFLGQCLASALIEAGNVKSETSVVPLIKLVLADIFFPPTLQPAIEGSNLVMKIQGDVSDPAYCDKLYAETASATHVSVFHLGAVMSGDGERDFDLCMRVNLHGFLNMIEGARRNVYEKLGFAPKFIFASAGATIGSSDPADCKQIHVSSVFTRVHTCTHYFLLCQISQKRTPFPMLPVRLLIRPTEPQRLAVNFCCQIIPVEAL
jgi:nucleoside-diphosphate-sugar epimerase